MGIRESLDAASNVLVKENLLMVSINENMVGNGWKLLEESFRPSEFFSMFAKKESPLNRISIKASAMGNMLKVNFKGERASRSSMEDIIDSNSYEISKTFNVNMYVTDDIEMSNEQLLSNAVCLVIKELEDKLA
ncbi:MAG: hypothetical protein K0A89_12105 [ANME-2 cluster archaeon]|nr:hypothetical protein [ANME-2 cluster archaeon]